MKLMQIDPVLAEYSRLAARYDRKWSFYVEASVSETLQRLDLKPGERLLDIGCGTGSLLQAIRLAGEQTELFGVDPSTAMLAVAQKKLPSCIDLRQGDAENLPFPDQSFTTVVSTSVFHYFRRPLEALHEFHRVLKPNGQIILTDWCDDYLSCRLCDMMLRLVNRSHFRTYGTTECKQLLENATFQAIKIDRYKINWLWGLMTAKGYKQAV